MASAYVRKVRLVPIALELFALRGDQETIVSSCLVPEIAWDMECASMAHAHATMITLGLIALSQ